MSHEAEREKERKRKKGTKNEDGKVPMFFSSWWLVLVCWMTKGF